MEVNNTDANCDVSIVLVAYNRAMFIGGTLESIANQTYPHFEVLICDDCSVDETETVCREFVARDNRFRYIRNERNLGMPGNLNAGLRRARYEYVATFHDGDIYAPTLIEKWRGALIKYPSAGFVFNRYRGLGPEGQTWYASKAFPELVAGREFVTQRLAEKDGTFPVWGTVMSRKSIYEELNYLNPRYNFIADIDLDLRIADKYDVAHVPEVLIDLPHKKVVPHEFKFPDWAFYYYQFRVIWNAIQRHYRQQPVKMASALVEHAFAYPVMLGGRARRKLMRMIRQSRQGGRNA